MISEDSDGNQNFNKNFFIIITQIIVNRTIEELTKSESEPFNYT